MGVISEIEHPHIVIRLGNDEEDFWVVDSSAFQNFVGFDKASDWGSQNA